MILHAPFPWYGGKSRVASVVWERFGDVAVYAEPFAGSLAVLLGRPDTDGPRIETVNDLDGFICNAWRAILHDPDATAHHADWPANENDLTARHAWLVEQRGMLTRRLEGDPEWFDAKAAGHESLERDGWSVFAWSATGGAAAVANAHRERIWFSPACQSARQTALFSA